MVLLRRLLAVACSEFLFLSHILASKGILSVAIGLHQLILLQLVAVVELLLSLLQVLLALLFGPLHLLILLQFQQWINWLGFRLDL
jgi:hypothetical protein